MKRSKRDVGPIVGCQSVAVDFLRASACRRVIHAISILVATGDDRSAL